MIINSVSDFLVVLEQLEQNFQELVESKDENFIAKSAIVMGFNCYQLPYLDKVYKYFTFIPLDFFNEQIFTEIEKSQRAEKRMSFYLEKGDNQKIDDLSFDVGFLLAVSTMYKLMEADSRIGSSLQFQNFKERFTKIIQSEVLNPEKHVESSKVDLKLLN
jgi:hypothetical protein